MNSTKPHATLSWGIANIAFLAATLGVNYLGSSGFFNGMSQKDVSDKYTTLLTPAGFAFSIWGVIYTLVLAALVYLVVKRHDPRVSRLVLLISPLFIASCVLNMGWIITFSYEFVGLSTLMILGLVVALLLIVQRIYENRTDVPYLLAGLAFTLYGAWVFIASILNVAIVLVQREWNGFGLSPSTWTIVTIILAVALTAIYLTLYRNAAFPISLAWAFFGILSSYRSGRLAPPMSTTIQALLIFGIVAFIAFAVIIFIKNDKSMFPRNRVRSSRTGSGDARN